MKTPRGARALAAGIVFAVAFTISIPAAQGATVAVSPGAGTLQAAMDAATSGDTLVLAPGTYVEPGDVPAKDLTIIGDDDTTTIITPAADTGTSGDDRGWFLTGGANTFNVSNVTFDGAGKSVCIALYLYGSGTVEDNTIKNISCGQYNGRGVYLKGATTVRNNHFENIERIGVFAWSGSNTTISGNDYVGKGTGDHLDYAFEVSGGGVATITGNTVTGNTGVAAVDGSDSAAILVSTYFGAGSTATITNNTITGNTIGVAVGFDAADTSTVTVQGNDLSDNTASAVRSTAPNVVAAGNWYGSVAGPTHSSNPDGTGTEVSDNVTYGPWCTDASCSTQSDNANLTGLSLSSGTLSPAFDPSTTSYAASVGNEVNSITVNRTVTPGAISTVSGTVLNNIGANTVTVNVTSADATAQKAYIVTVNRATAAPPPTTTTTEPPPPPTTTPSTTAPPTTTTTEPPPTTTTTVPPVVARPPDDPPPPPPPPAQPTVVSVISTPTGNGSIQVTPTGEIISTGDAPKLVGVEDKSLNAQIVGATLTPSGEGAWLVGADGGVFTSGDAPYLGSTGDKKLNAEVIGIAPTPTGNGYLLVAKDGGVFNFGDSRFYGSMGGEPLNAPINGAAATPTGSGYWLLGDDGGVFSFGDARFYGSLGGTSLDSKAIRLTPTSTGNGYWITTASGKIYSFGDAAPA